jgi:hypothetical protein
MNNSNLMASIWPSYLSPRKAANQLMMAEIKAILTLHKSRHTNRAIAHPLKVDRGTVVSTL